MSEWVKCSDRMPENGKPVLVYDETMPTSERFSVAAYDRGGWSAMCGVSGWEWEFEIIPTHWMQLPESPPAEEGK